MGWCWLIDVQYPLELSRPDTVTPPTTGQWQAGGSRDFPERRQEVILEAGRGGGRLESPSLEIRLEMRSYRPAQTEDITNYQPGHS